MYLKDGYVPNDQWAESGSRTLDYAFDDYAASIVASHAGDSATAADLLKRSDNYRTIYNANTTPDRLAKQKNLTEFYVDLKDDTLPQWMFITPNMTSDGHDTSVTTAGQWTRNFLEPLLNDPSSNFWKRTLVLVTFDETHTYTIGNKVFSILLGDALPENLMNLSGPCVSQALQATRTPLSSLRGKYNDRNHQQRNIGELS